jgi:hypothetical protein
MQSTPTQAVGVLCYAHAAAPAFLGQHLAPFNGQSPFQPMKNLFLNAK